MEYNRRRVLVSIAIHMFWYTFGCPYFAGGVFIALKGALDNGFHWAVVFDGLVASALAVLVVLERSASVAVLMLVVILICKKRSVIVANFIAVFLCPWVLLAGGPSFFLSEPRLVFCVAFLFSVVTILLYSLLEIHSLAEEWRRSDR